MRNIQNEIFDMCVRFTYHVYDKQTVRIKRKELFVGIGTRATMKFMLSLLLPLPIQSVPKMKQETKK